MNLMALRSSRVGVKCRGVLMGGRGGGVGLMGGGVPHFA